QFGFTHEPVKKYCLMRVTGSKYGMHVTASRAVCFGTPDNELRQEFDATCRVTAAYLYGSRASAAPRDIIQAGRRVYTLAGYEHQWLAGSQGAVTGRAPIELMLRPNSDELLQAGWGITWQAAAGAALSCDTFLVTEQGAECVTPMEAWPVKRMRVQGDELVRP